MQYAVDSTRSIVAFQQLTLERHSILIDIQQYNHPEDGFGICNMLTYYDQYVGHRLIEGEFTVIPSPRPCVTQMIVTLSVIHSCKSRFAFQRRNNQILIIYIVAFFQYSFGHRSFRPIMARLAGCFDQPRWINSFFGQTRQNTITIQD